MPDEDAVIVSVPRPVVRPMSGSITWQLKVAALAEVAQLAYLLSNAKKAWANVPYFAVLDSYLHTVRRMEMDMSK